MQHLTGKGEILWPGDGIKWGFSPGGRTGVEREDSEVSFTQ